MSLFFCWLAANIQINTHTHFYADIYIDVANHLETDILCPLLQHKWGQSHTHSTTNERGDPPKITTLLEPGATSDFMSAAARLIYSRSALSTPTAAQETHL